MIAFRAEYWMKNRLTTVDQEEQEDTAQTTPFPDRRRAACPSLQIVGFELGHFLWYALFGI